MPASAAPTTLRAILDDQPRFHVDGNGEPRSWQASDKVLHFIDEHVEPGANTLETGEGVSTVLFALRGCNHVAVSPNSAALERIRAYCAEHAVPLERVRFVEAPSDRALPGLELPELDLVLVDGGHGFPMPFIDWHYIAPHLRAGGYLVVDDTQLWTGRVLKEFLLAEPDWELVEDFAPRATVFRKVRAAEPGKEWTDQPYVARRSRRGVPGKVGTSAMLLRQGQYRTLAKMAGRVLRYQRSRLAAGRRGDGS